MPTEQNPIVISAMSSSFGIGDFIKFRNLTIGGSFSQRCNSSGEVILNNVPSTWLNGHSVSIEVYGKYNAGTIQTISDGGISYDFGTLTEDTSTENISL